MVRYTPVDPKNTSLEHYRFQCSQCKKSMLLCDRCGRNLHFANEDHPESPKMVCYKNDDKYTHYCYPKCAKEKELIRLK